MKIVFMGTPDFAVLALEAIVEAGHEVTCVVTQPDKPKGRGKEMQYTPVKECALKYGIPVFQPVKIKQPEEIAILREYEADIYVVAAFGQILSQEILDIPKFGCVNIHASLLPKYRGAAPIQWAILDGETQTGVTIMQMNAGLDTGDMLTKVVVPITQEDTGESLHDKLSAAGAKLIVETLPLIERGEIIPEKQDDSKSCYARMLNKAMGKIDWSRPAVEIERLVRGLNSWPSAFTSFRGKNLKIWEAKVAEIKGTEAKPGCVTEVDRESFTVQTGEGGLRIFSVQIEGKKRMTVRDFLLGYKVEPGERLGDSMGK
ncbi:MAG: methionyl-tRNA formyltransferase [Clostridiales bacterium]|nr:methionyl-tRNA formyltransferase [Clostridiales bacterium]